MGAEGGELTYETLMALWRSEKGSERLAKVPDSLYAAIQLYFTRLREEREREGAKDPTSAASQMLADQLKNALTKAKDLYERRQRKIGLLALRRAHGDQPAEAAHLTLDERELVDLLIQAFQQHEAQVATFEAVPPPAPAKEAAKAEPSKGRRRAAKASIPEEDYLLVRVLEDLPPFEGARGTYRLRKEDVVDLPRSIAATLLKHGKIAEIHTAQ